MEHRANAPRVVIALVRCQNGRGSYGIRFEQRDPRAWQGTWAFQMPERIASNEGYDKTDINGQIGFDDDYPGCPYCHSPSIFQCGNCAKIACWDGVTRKISCPWCGKSDTIRRTITSMGASGDA